MKGDELINTWKEIIRSYEASQPGSPTLREIKMWRENFLEEQDMFDDIHKTIYVKNVFHSLPSYEVLRKDLKELYNEISEHYSKDNK